MSSVRKTIRHKVTTPKQFNLKESAVLRQHFPFIKDFAKNPNFFQRILDNVPFHLGATDKEGYFILWNKISEKMFGYTKEEVIGKLKPDILHCDKKEAQEVSIKALKTGNFHGECMFRNKNGKCFHGLLDISVVKDNGNISCLLGSVVDLSKEKEIEAEHEIIKNKYQNLFINSKDAILQLDKRGNILDINQICEDISGYTPDVLIGKNIINLPFFSIKTKLIVAKKLKEIFVKGNILNLELDLQHKNGQAKAIEINANLVKKGGQFQYIQIMARDITKRRQIEKEHEISENKYREIFENSKDAILFVNNKGEILDGNKACTIISGYELKDFIGKYVFKLPFLRFQDRHMSLIPIFFKKHNVDLFDIELIHNNGQKKIVEVSVGSSKSKYFQLIIRDITARKKAENALHESEDIYRTIFENTGTATLIIEEDMTISFANDKFVKMSGYSKKEVINKMQWPSFFVQDDVNKMKEFHRLRRLDPESAPRNYESRFIDKKGNIRNLYLTVGMIPGTKKSVASLLDITQIKVTENKLMASKKLFDDLVEGTPVAIFVINTDHKIIYWNKALEQLTGLKASDMIGTFDHWKPFYTKKTTMITDMIVDRDNLSKITQFKRYHDMDIEECSKRKGIVCSKYFKNFNGQKRWLRFIIKPLYDHNNKMIGAIETVEDVTDRKVMRQSLENRMREFHVLYQVNDHIRMLDPLKNVFRKIIQDLTLACDEIKPARARMVFDNAIYTNLKHDEKFVRKIEEPIIVLGKKRGSIQLGYIRKIDNKESFSLKYEKKVLLIVAKTIGRHTQHREVVTRYRKLVNKSVVGIFILQDGVFKYVNPKFTRIFKLHSHDIIGANSKDVASGCMCNISGKNTHFTTEIKRGDNKNINIEIFTQSINYYGKEAILGTIQDVTRLKDAQRRQKNFNKELQLKISARTAELQKANNRLQSLNELKDEFIAVTSHELRSPLTAARGYLSFLTDNQMFDNIPKEAKNYLVRAHDNIELLNNLVNNILDVSRMEMGRFELQLKLVNIAELIEQSIKSLHFQAHEKGLTVNFINNLNNKSLMLSLDQVRILQVFRNILDNAIKYSNRGGEICVEIKIRGIGVEISIADKGMGIRKSEIFVIFDKFRQAKNAHVRYKGGAGLGLFIAKKIIGLHNGMIWAESRLNKGTIFKIQLPL